MIGVPSSLRGRLTLGAVAITLVAGLVTLYGVGGLLERFITGQIDQRLDNKILALASQVRVQSDKTIALLGNADGPPFDKPRHQSFWWIAGPRNSLQTAWLGPGAFTPPTQADYEAAAPPPPPGPDAAPPGGGPALRARTLRLEGPDHVPVHARLARFDIGGARVSILAAAPVRAIADPLRDALSTLGFAILGLGLVLLASAVLLVRVGLAPLARLQEEIAEVRGGRRVALSDRQPREVRPLVDELNSLLAQNAENLARARRHVANLAHGLKTPLATLSLAANRIAPPERTQVQDLVVAIERRVRHHLGRARAAALEGPVRAHTVLRPRLSDLLGMLEKIHADRQIRVTLDCAPEAAVACEPQDVDEMLGNLLENAFKYTRTSAVCRVEPVGEALRIAISDDGPGLGAQEIVRAMRPGLRLDETVPGHGFGLPITRELAELYGGTLDLTAAGPSGLVAVLTLPRAR